MARLTITLPDEMHRALKARAATCGKSVEEFVVEQLLEDERADAKRQARSRAIAILEQARANAAAAEPQLTEDELMEFAVAEVRALRRETQERSAAARHR